MSKWGSEEQETLNAINKVGFKGNVLNMAAGDGRFNNQLLSIKEVSKVVAIDINDVELEELKKFTIDKYKRKLTTKQLDITEKLPFSDNEFDGILCTGTLHLFSKEIVINILKQINRILKKDGQIVINFVTEVTRTDENGNDITYDGEGNYTSKEVINIIEEELKNYDLSIEKTSFTEENLSDEIEYDFISGEIVIVSGIKNK